MARLIPIDAAGVFGAGEVLRAALTLAGVTGQGFELSQIRAAEARPGLRQDQTAAVRASGLCCAARVHGAFDGSPDLRFEPGLAEPGEFHFELPGAAPAPVVLQTVLPILAVAGGTSRVEVSGGTHVSGSPSSEYLSRHWCAAVAGLGLRVESRLVRAGFHPGGGGELHATTDGWTRPQRLTLDERGALVALRGVSGAARLKGDVAARQQAACARELWEERRLEVAWERAAVASASPGAFLYLEASFVGGRAAFVSLGERRLGPEAAGERAARRLLHFLDGEPGAVDGPLADQLVVPMALSGGGRVTTPEVTPRLKAVAATVALFGIPARVWGRVGGPGGVEVDAC